MRDKCFGRLKTVLEEWHQVHKDMYPGAPHSLPEPEQFGLHRLAGGGGVMSDGCNQARALQNELVRMIAEATKLHIGEEVWDGMTEEEQNRAARVHIVNCWNHFRNTYLRWAIKREKELLKEALEDDLNEFNAADRITTDMDSVVRALAKFFCWIGSGNNLYAKGEGNHFFAWVIEKRPNLVVYAVDRADLGIRMDTSTRVS